MAAVLRGGKTSARLLKDFQLYAPDALPLNGDNILTQLPPPYNEASDRPLRHRSTACQHEWVLKELQSQLLEGKACLDTDDQITISICCRKCRTHATLLLEAGSNSWPCQSMHHWKYIPQVSQGFQRRHDDSYPAWEDYQEFQCSVMSCGTTLLIRMHGPQLSPENVSMLTDRDVLKARAQKEIEAQPEHMEGMPIPLPLNVLNNLRAYLNDSRNNPNARAISADNRRWLQCFGNGCDDLLAFLTFRREDKQWWPPHPPNTAGGFITPENDPEHVFLEDVVTEINILMAAQPEHELRGGQFTTNLPSAQGELERALVSSDYEKATWSRTQAAASYDTEHPYYAVLGAVQDMHDNVITELYKQQIKCDRENHPHYFDAFRGIAEGREAAQGRANETVATVIAIELSKGVVGTKEIAAAYKQFGLNMQESHEYEDEALIGQFKARVPDAPMQEPDLRKALAIIGKHKKSSLIEDFAANSINTYEQAMSYLGADESTTDDFIMTLAHMKAQDQPKEEEKARVAIDLIGKKRGSSALTTFATTGQSNGETTITVPQAYARFECDPSVADDSLLAAYDLACNDAPSQRTDLARHFAVIARHRGSPILLSQIPANMSKTSDRDPSSWPVGLENLGNTCYLNSILQSYFSIKEFREFVLNWEEFRKPLDDDAIKKHTVGQRQIEKSEVEESQRFLEELRQLFEAMTASPNPSVRPRQDLVVATLAPKDHAARKEADQSAMNAVQRRRSSVASPHVTKAMLPPVKVEATVVEDDAASLSSTQAIPDTSDAMDVPMTRASSEGTLVESDSPQQKAAPEPIIDEGPSRLDSPPNDDALPPLVEDTHPPTQPPPPRPAPAEPVQSIEEPETAPERPPPPPPNTDPDLFEEKIKNYLQQQDVSEVIGGILFRLSCAIVGRDGLSGEQQDQMKDLFWGADITTISENNSSKQTRQDAVPFNVISVNVAEKLEQALEVNFGVNEIEGSNKTQFKSIATIPPILQIEIIRAQQAHKDETNVELPLELSMDRFMDNADARLKEARQAVSLAMLEKAKLNARDQELMSSDRNHKLGGPGLLAAAAEYLSNTEVCEEETVSTLQDLSVKEQGEAEALSQPGMKEAEQQIIQAKLELDKRDPGNKKYLLHSVFVHRGSSYSGHYWIYIRDFKTNVWRKYNDGYVDIVNDTKEILSVTDSGVAMDTRKNTPYLMTYVDSSKVDDLIEPLHRNIKEPSPANDPVDVSMGGVDGAATDVQVIEGQDALDPRSPPKYQSENWSG